MIIGDTSTFAIESCITQAYERLSFRALGYFIIYINGMPYGVRKADATMLANAFDEAENIILNRGKHMVPFASQPNAGEIIDAVRKATYTSESDLDQFFGISKSEFINCIHSSHCEWNRVDEAFDDGSHILFFDVQNQVRLIADKPPKSNSGYNHDPNTLRDVWLEANKFYDIIKEWRKSFEIEWKNAAKI